MSQKGTDEDTTEEETKAEPVEIFSSPVIEHFIDAMESTDSTDVMDATEEEIDSDDSEGEVADEDSNEDSETEISEEPVEEEIPKKKKKF